MSLEKLAHDAYTQGFTDTLHGHNVPDSVKVATATLVYRLKPAVLFGGATGAIGAEEDERLMGALKGGGNFFAKNVGYGAGGAVTAGFLASLLTRNPALAKEVGVLGGVAGAGVGAGKAMYDNYHGDYGLFGES